MADLWSCVSGSCVTAKRRACIIVMSMLNPGLHRASRWPGLQQTILLHAGSGRKQGTPAIRASGNGQPFSGKTIPRFISAASLASGDDLNENEKFIMILQVVSTIVFIFYKAAFYRVWRQQSDIALEMRVRVPGMRKRMLMAGVFFRHRKTRRATWTPPRLHVED